jgi:NAD-dependent deacetylase
VVWFGESLEAETLDAATKACRNCDLLVSIGTSALVSPACELPLIARENGAVTVEVNLTTTMLTDLVDYSLPGKAATWLPTLLSAVSIR